MQYFNNAVLAGMGYSREGIRGKTEFMEQLVQSHLEKILHMSSKQKTRLAAIFTSRHFYSTRLREHLVASESGAVLGFLFHSLLLLGILLC